ncbi:YDG domain-containing protein [Paucibacter sp. AS339]|uniref:YDG domain-containing protein n=1 Tax=Paucibacter hankyongi TaxID=3133434 RepID=UPI0030AD3128
MKVRAERGIVAANKVYDGTTAATLNSSGAAFTGKVTGDSLSVATANGVFADKTAANGKTVAITGLSLGGTDAGNYVLDSNTASAKADITRAPISAVTGINALSKLEDGTAVAQVKLDQAVLVGRIGDDQLNVSSAAAQFDSAMPGLQKPVSIQNITLGGTDALNYQLLQTSSTSVADITAKPLPPTPPVAPPPAPAAVKVSEQPVAAPAEVARTSSPASTALTAGINVALTQAPSNAEQGLISVSVPRNTATAGSGFSFALPEPLQKSIEASGATARASTLKGEALPSWLRFDAATYSFIASAVPDGALPYQAVITINGQRTVVVIAERQD